MAESSGGKSGGGIGFVGLLTIVFITLKLTGFIDWSWWWVLSPIWITAIFVALVLIALIAVLWFTTPKWRRRFW